MPGALWQFVEDIFLHIDVGMSERVEDASLRHRHSTRAQGMHS
jgi:hypothetical protein